MQINNEMRPTCNLIRMKINLTSNNALMWDAHDKLEISKKLIIDAHLDYPITYRTFRHQ